MTLTSATTKSQYNGDDSTTAFATGFKFIANGDVKVIHRDASGTETTWTLNGAGATGYTLTGAGDDGGGTVTANTAPATGTTLTIKRAAAETQSSDLPAGGAFPSDTVEDALDRLTMLVQAHTEEFERTAVLAESSPTSGPLTIPEPTANQLLAWNAGATDLANVAAADVSLTTVSSFINGLLDDADAATARTTLGAQQDVITTRGDLVRGDSSGNAERFAMSVDGNAPVGDGTDVVATGIHKQGKHTIWVPVAAMRPTVSNGCAAVADHETTAGRPDITYMAFDASSDEHAQFSITMPKSWNGGTVTFQGHWTVNAAVSTGVAIALQAVGVADNETIDVAYGTAVVVTDDAQGAAEEELITAESSAITIGGTLTHPSRQIFRVFRDVSDANDDMTQDMWLEGLSIHITTDAADDT